MILNKFKFKSTFSKNVLTLMTGTTIAQVIPIAISPILTRIYTPDDFGFFALYMAFIAIGAAIVTGKYEMAIFLPKKQEHSKYLVWISIVFSLFFSFLIMIIYMLFSNDINLFFSLSDGNLYFIPFGIFLFSFYSILLQWMNRNKAYKLMSKNRVVQISSISFFQLLIGLIQKISYGLIIADIIGRAVSIIIILKSILHQIRLSYFSFRKSIYFIKRYKKFPFLEMPATALNIASFQIPYILMPIIFTSSIAGYYFLVFRVMMLPASLIGDAVLEVFKNRAINDLNLYGSCQRIYKKIFIFIFSIAILPTIIIIFYGESIFSFVFGQEWREAGQYAQILAPFAFLRLLSAPLSYIFVIREKLKLDFFIQLIFFIFTLASIAIAYFIDISTFTLVMMLSISGSIFYIIQIIFSYGLSNANK